MRIYFIYFYLNLFLFLFKPFFSISWWIQSLLKPPSVCFAATVHWEPGEVNVQWLWRMCCWSAITTQGNINYQCCKIDMGLLWLHNEIEPTLVRPKKVSYNVLFSRRTSFTSVWSKLVRAVVNVRETLWWKMFTSWWTESSTNHVE